MKTNERLSCIENKLNKVFSRLFDLDYEISSLRKLILKYEGTYKDKKFDELRKIMHNEGKMTIDEDFMFTKDSMQKIVNLFKEVLDDKESVEQELQKLKEEAEF